MPFLKQQRLMRDSGGNRLHWSRAQDDGAPFRGNNLPLLREHEYQDLVERVWDTHYGTFDTSQPDQVVCGRRLSEVLDAAMAGLFRIIHREWKWGEREGVPIMFMYIEWSEPYQELGQTPATDYGA